jgi:hypothetical protein
VPATSPSDDRRHAVAAELHHLAVRYAAGADRRDGEMFAGAFLPAGRLRVFDPPEAAGPRPTTVVMHIRYRDRYRRAGGRWGIEDRRVLVDWTETGAAGTSG